MIGDCGGCVVVFCFASHVCGARSTVSRSGSVRLFPANDRIAISLKSTPRSTRVSVFSSPPVLIMQRLSRQQFWPWCEQIARLWLIVVC